MHTSLQLPVYVDSHGQATLVCLQFRGVMQPDSLPGVIGCPGAKADSNMYAAGAFYHTANEI
jgi:hypothetical protein